MDFRKIIAFGKSSYVISLPKKWLNNNNLEKGDLVFIEEDNDKLTLRPKEKDLPNEEKKIVINIDGKDIRSIRRVISSAYIKNNDYIIIQGKSIDKTYSEITKIIHNFIALEILEQSSNRIVAKDLFNVKDINIIDYIKKEDIILRSILMDLKNPDFNNYLEIIERQNNAKRIYFLISKVIKSFKDNYNSLKKANLDLKELFEIYDLNKLLKEIAHFSKDIALNIDKSDFKKNDSFFLIMDEFNKFYLQFMRSIRLMDKNKAFQIPESGSLLIKKINKELNPKKASEHTIVKDLIYMINIIHNSSYLIIDVD